MNMDDKELEKVIIASNLANIYCVLIALGKIDPESDKDKTFSEFMNAFYYAYKMAKTMIEEHGVDGLFPP